MTSRYTLLSGIGLLGLLCGTAAADIIHVPADQPTIQAAIDIATTGDEIVVAAGTYTELIDLLGKAVVLRSESGAALTTIDGEGTGTVVTCVNGETAATIIDGFTITRGSGSTGGGMLIDSASPTVKNCVFTNNTLSYRGAGAYCVNSSSIFDSCTFTENLADRGAGLYFGSSTPLVTNCMFLDNTASYGGAGIRNIRSSSRIVDCVFRDNFAGTLGGAIGNAFGETMSVIENCQFIRNQTDFVGGAISTALANLTVNNSTFTENHGESGGALRTTDGGGINITGCNFFDNTASIDGGAFYADTATDAPGIFTDCLFEGNSAEASGGAVAVRFDKPIFVDCVFSNNTALDGGAVSTRGFGRPRIVNSYFLSNSALRGGAISNLDGAARTTNCIFTGNAAVEDGGAVYAEMDQINSRTKINNCSFHANTAGERGGAMFLKAVDRNTILRNSIFWGNGPAPIWVDGTPTIVFCDIEGGYPGIGNFSADPLFLDPLGPDGVAGTIDDDLRIPVTSPCIDAGGNARVPKDWTDLDNDGDTTEPLPFDFVGKTRFVDVASVPDFCLGEISGDDRIDLADLVILLGSFPTSAGATLEMGDLNFDGVIDLNDLVIMLTLFATPCDTPPTVDVGAYELPQ